MDSQLVNTLFKNRDYYKVNNSFGRFALDSEIMNNIHIPRVIDKNIALKELSIIQNVFNSFNIDFFLTHGSCLGAIREKDFIEYDSDIDIGCYKRDLKKITLALNSLREKYGFAITKLSIVDESIAIIKDNVIIDISLYRVENNIWKSNQNKIFETPFIFLDSLGEIDFLGIKINIPNNVEEYLKYQYGSDWRTPIKDFYNPYRQRIEIPITNTIKYLIGKKKAAFIGKRVSNYIKKVRNK